MSEYGIKKKVLALNKIFELFKNRFRVVYLALITNRSRHIHPMAESKVLKKGAVLYRTSSNAERSIRSGSYYSGPRELFRCRESGLARSTKIRQLFRNLSRN